MSDSDNCKNLWAAVLKQAEEDLFQKRYRLKPSAVSRNKDSAWTWFMSNNKGIGSFLYICEVLDLDPEYIRQGIKNMKAARRSDEVLVEQ